MEVHMVLMVVVMMVWMVVRSRRQVNGAGLGHRRHILSVVSVLDGRHGLDVDACARALAECKRWSRQQD